MFHYQIREDEIALPLFQVPVRLSLKSIDWGKANLHNFLSCSATKNSSLNTKLFSVFSVIASFNQIIQSKCKVDQLELELTNFPFFICSI